MTLYVNLTWLQAGDIPKGKPMYYFAFGGVVGAGLGAMG